MDSVNACIHTSKMDEGLSSRAYNLYSCKLKLTSVATIDKNRTVPTKIKM